MSLTFTNGMTLADNSDVVTNWSAVKLPSGGGTLTAATDATVYKQGTASNSTTVAKDLIGCLLFDYYTKNSNATLDLTVSGREVVSMWVLVTTVSMMKTLALGGGFVIISSTDALGTTSPTVYSKWYVTGSDTYPGGWVLITLDTRKAPSEGLGGK